MAPLRLVLFGPAGAGKSALLAALAQAADTQASALGGNLIDRSGSLAELQEKLYASKDLARAQPRHAVTWETKEGPVNVELIDCSGNQAEAMLAGKTPLESSLLHADGIVFVADPSAGVKQLESDFQEFCRFVARLEEARSRQNETIGLPIYWVLAKSDLLAKSTDSNHQWMQKIEEHKHRFGERLAAWWENEPGRSELAFGKADVHLWATAVKRPALADRPGRPQEPFGVAELFRQALESARRYQERRDHTWHQLLGSIVGLGGLALVLGLVGAALLLNRPDADLSAFESRVRSVLPGEAASAPERFREPFAERLADLENFRADPRFERLPSSLQLQVVQLRREMEEYQDHERRFNKQVPDLRGVKDEKDLDRIDKALENFTLPPEKAEAWAETRLERQRAKKAKDVAALRHDIGQAETWFKEQKKTGDLLWETGRPLADPMAPPAAKQTWRAQVENFLAQNPPFRRDHLVYRFQKVTNAQEEWEETKVLLVLLMKRVK